MVGVEKAAILLTTLGPETAAAAAQLTQENLALTQQNPERAAQLVREWLREGAPAIEG